MNGREVLPFQYSLVFAERLFLHALQADRVALPFSPVQPRPPSFDPSRKEPQTASLFLPFARLLLRTCLPPLVAILTRKPCVLFLFVLVVFLSVFFISSFP